MDRFAITLAGVGILTTLGTAAPAQQVPGARERLSQLGPEGQALAQRAGTWDVTLTTFSRTGAAPVVLSDLVARRQMIGPMLQEVLRSAPSTPGPAFERVDDLTFNRTEGRWEYMSMDTNAAAGLMVAWSLDRDPANRIQVGFLPFADAGSGPEATGQMLRMEQTIIHQDANHERKDQYFTPSGGEAAKFLMKRYTYVRAGSAADVPVPPPGTSSRIDAIQRRGTLRVAVLNEYPWLKQTAGGSKPFEGPAWQLAEEYAKRLGVTLETVPVDFDTKVSVLAGGQADITIAPLLATPERAKSVDLILYSVSAQCLFGRADNPKVAGAAGIDDLNRPEIRIAYIAGSPQGAWLQKRLPRAAHRPIAGSLADVPVAEVLSRRADVSTVDKFFFTGLAQKTPGLITLPKDYMTSRELPIPIGMAISKGQPELLTWLRAVAAAVRPEVAAEETRVEKAGS